ncbi:hypothetical protein [Micromonospora sp. NPDC051006]|uniref:hypothetical protein n=1 Tax=Micromonospora sp. NPDC051006 TaxID=3364283 RepID=UPI003789F94D
MTDAPDPAPRPANRWRQWGSRGLSNTRDASVHSGRWLRHNWQRLAASLRDQEPARSAPPPPGPLVEQRDAPGLIAVPARGYVYCFYIRATFAWSSPAGLRAEVLSWYAQYFMPHAVQRLTRLAADAARDLPAHRAGDLELALQQALAEGTPWPYERGDVLLTCQPDATVRLDDKIWPALQPHMERQVTLECQYDEQLRKARYAEQLSRRWASILGEHVEGTSQPDAALAEARQQMLTRQRSAARWIDDLLANEAPTPPPPPPTARPIPPQPSKPAKPTKSAKPAKPAPES